jgi:hypothetical protein
MVNLWVEYRCPEHGYERFKIKVIKKYNVNPNVIIPKFRTRPMLELGSIIIGRRVGQNETRDYLIQYFKETGLMDRVLSIKIQV